MGDITAASTVTDEDRQKLIFGDGPLQKAELIFLNAKGKTELKIPVQFNPKEFNITRTMKYKDKNGVGKESHPSNRQPIKGEAATLSMELQIDSASALVGVTTPPGFSKYLNKNELSDIIKKISLLTKYNYENHVPQGVIFHFGTMAFMGNVTKLSNTYQMFNRDGKPVQAKMSIEIVGEDKNILDYIKANPNESPDRTKFRALGPADELWMLADQEYADSGSWKTIAKENGILNPRKIDRTKLLKVPSI